jgi:hypothetical protein
LRSLLVISTAVFLLAGVKGYGQVSHRGDDIRQAMDKYGQAEVMIDYPGFNTMSDLALRFDVSSCDGKNAVLCLSERTGEAFIMSGIGYKLLIPEGRKGFYTASSVAEAMLWQTYPTWKHYDTIMHTIAAKWPDVCRLDTIGFSIMGRAVLALKISDNVNADEDEPAVMLSASIHGDETAGFVLLMRLAEYLASESVKGGLAEALTSGLEIWINPIANPDGMYRNNDTIIYPVRTNSAGYDLNRNFPDPEVTSPPPLQRETVDMIRFMEKHRFVISANLHAGTEVVNYPWDKWTRLHADDIWFNDISRRYADTVHLHAEPGYMSFLDNGVTRGSLWYVVRGGRQDFITYSFGGREVTIEMDDIKMTPGTNLESLWNWNYRSLLRYLGEALFGIHGTVTDADNGNPLGARIFITGHDSDSSHVYSDTLTGEFCRLLAPGTYNFTVTAKGYIPYTFDVTVTSYDYYEYREIKLQPDEVIIYPDPPDSSLLIYPDPSSGHFSILTPETVTGDIIVTFTTITGEVINSNRTTALPGIPVRCDFPNLPDGIYIVSVRKLPYGPLIRGKILISRFISR